jgi:transposase-like protein
MVLSKNQEERLTNGGLQTARLFVGDGHLGLWAAVGDVFPEEEEQLYWNHKSLNLLDAFRTREQAAAKPHPTAMIYAESRSKACEARKQLSKVSSTSRGWSRKVPDTLLLTCDR